MKVKNRHRIRYSIQIIDDNPDGIFWADIDGRILYANSAMCDLLGYSKKKLLDRNILKINPKRKKSDFGRKGKITRAITKKKLDQLSSSYRHKNGSLVPVEVTVLLLSKNPYLVCCFVKDVTERNQMEKKLRRKMKATRQAKDQLLSTNTELEKLVSTDFLTGAWSRRRFFETADNEIEQAKRYGNDLALIMIDIDFFKQINDDLGHPTGDVVLTRLVSIIKASIREADCLVRWGGEEFVVLLPQTNADGAFILADRLRKLVENTDFGIDRKITVSIGLAEREEQDGIDALIERADKALYKAKSSGRNNTMR